MKKSFENLLESAITGLVSDENSIRKKIIIREDFRLLIPPLSEEEIRLLEENILIDGVRDPLIIWEHESQYILVDGHNRFAISEKYNLDFPFKVIQFKNEEEVRDWMIINQLGRRNLTKEQSSYLRGLRYNREKSQGKRTDLTSAQNEPKFSHSTASALAKEYNVSEATIKRDGDFAKGLDQLDSVSPGTKEQVLTGKIPSDKKVIQAIGKNSIPVEDFQKADVSIKVTKTSKPTALEIAGIAMRYIRDEKRALAEVIKSFDLDEHSDPIQFFLTWSNHKPR